MKRDPTGKTTTNETAAWKNLLKTSDIMKFIEKHKVYKTLWDGATNISEPYTEVHEDKTPYTEKEIIDRYSLILLL
jgi:hypothetical protein